MFCVYAKSHGQPRRLMGHFKTESAAKKEGLRIYEAFPSDEVVIVEEADNGRTNFVDAPQRAEGSPVAPIGPDIEVERLAKAGKDGK